MQQNLLDLLTEIQTIFKELGVNKNNIDQRIQSCISSLSHLEQPLQKQKEIQQIQEIKQEEKENKYQQKQNEVMFKKKTAQFQEPYQEHSEQTCLSQQEIIQQYSRNSLQFLEKSFNSQNNTKSILIDWFIFSYDFQKKAYIIKGNSNQNKNNRKVYLDLLTSSYKKQQQVNQLKKTSSMTNILEKLFKPGKIQDPVILPNCLSGQKKYFFAFGVQQCQLYEGNYFNQQTYYCFLSHYFIDKELKELVEGLVRTAFQQNIVELSNDGEEELESSVIKCQQKEDTYLYKQTINNFNKQLSNQLQQQQACIQSLIRTTQNNIYFQNVVDYLKKSSNRFTRLRINNQKQKMVRTITLMFYLAINQQKIILVSGNQNRHICSELIVGLLEALHPMSYCSPIVLSTITKHHSEFIESPVPLIVGTWGSTNRCKLTIEQLRSKVQNYTNYSSQELQKQCLTSLIDLDDHIAHLHNDTSKNITEMLLKLQKMLEDDIVNGNLSLLLANFMKMTLLSQDVPKEEWMKNLRQKVQESQMYEMWKYNQ